MNYIHIINGGEEFTFPLDDDFVSQFNGIPSSLSQGHIMKFRYDLERTLPEAFHAPAVSCMVRGKLTIPDRPISDCLAAAFHIFNNTDIDSLPRGDDGIFGHIYNVLCSCPNHVDVSSFMLNFDEWCCIDVQEES